jgi:tight adherence protein C
MFGLNSGGPTFLGIDLAFLAMIVAGVAALFFMFSMWQSSTVKDPMAVRLRALNERREQLKAGITASRTKQRINIMRSSSDLTSLIKNLLGSMQVLQDSQLSDAQLKLVQAGIRSKDSAILVIFARLILPVVLGGGMVLAVYGLGWLADWSAFKKYTIVAGTFGISYYLPNIILKNLIDKRMAAIQRGLPDALDLLVICAEAGLTIDAALSRVNKELGRAFPILGDEFTLTAIELGFLTDRRSAFDNLAMRVPLDSIRGVVTTLIQTEKYGTPLASSLRVLSAEFRHQRMMKAEEKAARLPAIMTVPLIAFILPVLFIVILGPATCQISDNFLGKN